MASRLRLIFEVENLSSASPATISRCGVLQVDRTLVILCHLGFEFASIYQFISAPRQRRILRRCGQTSAQLFAFSFDLKVLHRRS